jgi:VanZ like family
MSSTTSWGYYKNVMINIGGFVPLGFRFCTYFSSMRRLDRAVIATIVFGAVVSFTIEVLQAFLPTRDSGIAEVITNTLGTGMGALLYDREFVWTLLATIGLGVPKGTPLKEDLSGVANNLQLARRIWPRQEAAVEN